MSLPGPSSDENNHQSATYQSILVYLTTIDSQTRLVDILPLFQQLQPFPPCQLPQYVLSRNNAPTQQIEDLSEKVNGLKLS